jgi:hypothetical protein
LRRESERERAMGGGRTRALTSPAEGGVLSCGGSEDAEVGVGAEGCVEGEGRVGAGAAVRAAEPAVGLSLPAESAEDAEKRGEPAEARGEAE